MVFFVKTIPKAFTSLGFLLILFRREALHSYQ